MPDLFLVYSFGADASAVAVDVDVDNVRHEFFEVLVSQFFCLSRFIELRNNFLKILDSGGKTLHFLAPLSNFVKMCDFLEV